MNRVARESKTSPAPPDLDRAYPQINSACARDASWFQRNRKHTPWVGGRLNPHPFPPPRPVNRQIRFATECTRQLSIFIIAPRPTHTPSHSSYPRVGGLFFPITHEPLGLALLKEPDSLLIRHIGNTADTGGGISPPPSDLRTQLLATMSSPHSQRARDGVFPRTCRER